MAALADLLPALARAYQTNTNRKIALKMVLDRAGLNGREKAAIARQQSAKPKPEIKKPSHNPIPLVTPAHARPFDNGGKTMRTPQQLAAIGKAEKNEIARLSDK
jgi:hypothetical protein